ncbi:unnamed protein product, partial [Gulo gulo]
HLRRSPRFLPERQTCAGRAAPALKQNGESAGSLTASFPVHHSLPLFRPVIRSCTWLKTK